MVFFYALFGAIVYALHYTIMAPIYRRLDTYSVICIRSLSLGLSMLPLLLFVSPRFRRPGLWRHTAKSGACVRVINLISASRTLLKSYTGSIVDLEFANYTNDTLATVNDGGKFMVRATPLDQWLGNARLVCRAAGGHCPAHGHPCLLPTPTPTHTPKAQHVPHPPLHNRRN